MRVTGLADMARHDLAVESVFGPEYWAEDATWKYDVPGEEEGEEILWQNVVLAHPMIKKWDAISMATSEEHGVMTEKHINEMKALKKTCTEKAADIEEFRAQNEKREERDVMDKKGKDKSADW